ncbi:MAG TPA: penicillin acylase family protein [Streptosporangiaceae bacterium]|nr:penicillin acylase family protein [Streptosporangiaceae bacterium]
MELPAAGLEEPADILIDPWGIPHIYAASTHDAFWAQGFQVARDRLWQIDTWRRRGLGLLSEVWGPAYVEQDRAARLFLYRGDMHAEWLAYSSDTKRIASAFTAGINAYVAMTREDPGLLPLEFRELGYEPSCWAPSDVARIRSHGLSANVAQEVARALTVRDFGVAVEELRRQRQPWRELIIPDGLDLTLIPADVLRDYLLATMPAQFPAPGGAAPSAQLDADAEGSNNWVLAPGRTATGRPLLADDPHRAVTLPSLRYLSHLSAPGFDVIGAGEPALPGISVGHNGHIAFGLTVFPVDQEDLYVYRTRPGHPLEYRYQDRWEPMRVVREQIPVRDGPPAGVELAFTRHGPVIRMLPDQEAAFAVRAAWLEPGTAPYLGSVEYMRARNLEQFTAALNRWGVPGENQVYADTEGNIAWKAAGLTPIRPNWDGTLPVPGDGRYEWAGFYDMDELPAEVNPARGWIVTANEMNLPADFPPDRVVTRDWAAPNRRDRIAEVLAAGESFSAADMVGLQSDFVSIPARRITARLAGMSLADPAAARAAALLAGWDGTLAADSAAAAVFQVWYRRHLRPGLLRRALEQLLPAARVPAALAALLPGEDLVGEPRIDLDLVEKPGPRLGADPDQALAEVFESTLRDAMADVTDLLGTDEGTWAWGRLHQARLTHPAAAALGDAARQQAAIAPLPRGGSSDTPGATTYLPDFSQAAGATFRIVVDVGEWDNSLAMNSPGQSGDPASPHYADLFAGWAAGGSFPLLYRRERIEEVAQQRLRLVPRAAPEI